MKAQNLRSFSTGTIKSNKSKRKGLRLNRNFFILQGVAAVIILYLTWGSLTRFIITLAIEVFAYSIFMYFMVSSSFNNKNKMKKPKVLKKNNVQYRSNSNTVSDEDNSRRLKKVVRSNYNWNLEENGPKNKHAEKKSIAENNTKKIETPKFVPYRSPFDPVLPKSNTVVPDKENKNEEILVSFDAEIIEEKSEYSEIGNINIESIKNCHINEKAEEQGIVSAKIEGILKTGEENFQLVNDEEDLISFQNENDGLIEYPVADKGYEPERKETVLEFDTEETVLPQSLSDNNKRILIKKIEQQNSKIVPLRTESVIYEKKSGMEEMQYRPSMDLLKRNDILDHEEESMVYLEYNAKKLVETLASFGVGAKVINVSKGPTVTRYELQPNAGVKVSKIINLSDDIALNLAATGVRIEAPIPGKAAVGIEIPNKNVVPVYLRDVIESEEFQEYSSKLAFAIGKDIAGNVVVGDIAKMPHMLIAGATGSGKSVCINTLIISILYKATPSEVKLLMVDPKVVELGIYNGIPHLLIPVVTDPKKAAGALSWAVLEMTNRYKLFAENNVRDLKGYNALVRERGEGATLPQIVIIIDELADLMMVAPNEVEDCICRLAQMARAAGMHLVIATQRPSVDVITGVIKANIPSRISFAVSSQIDSRTILDMAGAEKLLGRGDMLFYPLGQPKPVRVQGGFISDKEVESIVSHIKAVQTAEYDEEVLQKIDDQNETQKPDLSGDDELLPQAIEMVLDLGQASASLIQRKFKVGYSRAARIIDQMEAWGVVSAADGSKPRQILITKSEWEELNA